jgi:hypothetical protein
MREARRTRLIAGLHDESDLSDMAQLLIAVDWLTTSQKAMRKEKLLLAVLC